MARTKSTVPANRFAVPASVPVERLGFSSLPAGRYTKRDEYGFHILRVLADAQEITYTVTKSGMLVEKINFVPSKERRDGNAAYGNRWLNIVAYRQSDDYNDDMAVAAKNGLIMAPAPKGPSKSPAAGWASA